MKLSWGYLIPLIAIVVLGSIERLWAHRRHAAATRRRRIEDALGRADELAVLGAWEDVAALVDREAQGLDRDRDPRARELEARTHLLVAELESARGRLDEAEARLRTVRVLRTSAGSGRCTRERFVEALLRQAGGDPGAAAATAGEVLADGEAAALEPAQVLRLARLAIDCAERELSRGSWPEARTHFERAVRLGQRLDPEAITGPTGEARERARLIAALARARGAYAAGEIGQVLASLGRSDEALEWLDRAVSSLGSSDHATVRVSRARALIVRAMHEPPDADPGGEARATRLRRARDETAGLDWPVALGLGARAEIQLGVLAGGGEDLDPAGHFRAAAERLAGVEVAGAAEMIAEARMLLGHTLEEHGHLDEARTEYRRAFDAGRRDEDPDARRLAVVAACHLHRLLHVGDRTDEARELLDALEEAVPSLAAPVRPLLAAMTGRCRGQQRFRDGDPEGAGASLREALGLIEASETPEARDLARQLVADLGHLALGRDESLEAEQHFRRVLTLPPGARPPAVDQAERAEWYLGLAQALARLERPAEAGSEWRRAFQSGRDSGRASGRAAAAAAALHLGDDPESSEGERKRWYETAASLGRLSGTARGRQVVEAVEARLRERTD